MDVNRIFSFVALKNEAAPHYVGLPAVSEMV